MITELFTNTNVVVKNSCLASTNLNVISSRYALDFFVFTPADALDFRCGFFRQSRD
jgi:hypothetical protein